MCMCVCVEFLFFKMNKRRNESKKQFNSGCNPNTTHNFHIDFGCSLWWVVLNRNKTRSTQRDDNNERKKKLNEMLNIVCLRQHLLHLSK